MQRSLERPKFGLRVNSAIGLSFFILFASCAGDQTYPADVIDFTVPWGEGGGTDTVSREFLSAVEHSAAWDFRINYRIGESGVRGHGYLAEGDKFGYTLGAITSEITLMHWRQLTDLTYRNYTPFGLLALDSAVVAVRSDSPWYSLEDLLASLISESEDTFSASGTAKGGIWDLARPSRPTNLWTVKSSLTIGRFSDPPKLLVPGYAATC